MHMRSGRAIRAMKLTVCTQTDRSKDDRMDKEDDAKEVS
jgi:hypothetical protein